jgi:hypothetical protein
MSIATVTQDVLTQLQERIQADVRAFQGELPERYSIAWRAYLAGLAEWGVIDFETQGKLIAILPKVSEPDPVESILLGRD